MPFPAPWNLVGAPTASIPCGQSNDGLPIGLLAAGPRGSEQSILRVAEEFEGVRPWPSPAEI
jgi:Asp-tRNA(Asn)/Glu-tRNA(Gln) amidotransferase A subunit family amidase